MKIGIVQFPGSTCDRDVFEMVTHDLNESAEYLWYDSESCDGFDLVVLPGGFSYGDSLRPGAIAAETPVMSGIKKFTEKGGLVLGICNGFQILCESGLLPGRLLENQKRQFICRPSTIKMELNRSFLPKSDVLNLSIAHGAGRYFAEEEILKKIEKNQQIVFRYGDDNLNRSQIAGVCNKKGNVVGMMPHPERTLGFPDGLRFWKSLVKQFLESKL